MTSIIEFIIIFFTAFGFNLIPFAGPSNLLIASNFGVIMGETDVSTLLLVGLIIALAAAFAKGIHYMVTFFISGHLSEKRRARLDTDAVKVKRWAFPLLFLVAASPIPDEPVVIPLGLMKYSPVKFFTAYFLGKLSITIVGAFIGNLAGDFLSAWFSPESTFVISIIVSIILTIVVTVILLKVDLGKLTKRISRRKTTQIPKADQEKPNKGNEEPNTHDNACPLDNVGIP